MRSYLAAKGLDVSHHTSKGSLVFSSDQHHVFEGCFDVDGMLSALEDALDRSMKDGHEGLWATGDMTWEFGPQRDFSKLLEYETRLEEFFRQHPTMSGICQYHVDTLPREALRQGLLTHPAIFINETLSRVNAHYLSKPAESAGRADCSP